MSEIQHQDLDWKILSPLLPKRSRTAHKNDFGHVLVIGGDHGMGGAVRLSAEAALRVGAGLVSVATRKEHLSLVCSGRPEIMCHSIENAEEIKPLLEKATVIVIGPGLGQGEWSQRLLAMVLHLPQPKIIDADALNLLSQAPEKLTHAILTPHPGEAARLLACTRSTVQADRYSSAKKIAEQYDAVVVLKGSGSIVTSHNAIPAICQAGNPGMATAGMGDVLSGVIAGLVAQGLSLLDAAKLGVLMHAMAADAVAKENGERGMLASDLMLPLRRVANAL